MIVQVVSPNQFFFKFFLLTAVFWQSSLQGGCQIIKAIPAGAFINYNQSFTRKPVESFIHQLTGQRADR